MIRKCGRPLAAVLVLALAVPAIQAQCSMSACTASCEEKKSEDRMVQKTYPIAPVLHAFGCCPSCPDMLVKFMTQCIAPATWSDHGGKGTMDFCPLRMALIVCQTPEVHKQVGALVKAMDQMASAYAGPMTLVPVGYHVPPPPPMVCPAPPTHVSVPVEKSVHSPEPKQHFRFVLDNLRFRTDEKNILTIKRVEVEYAGDGIDGDVAKCAITLGQSEKMKAEVEAEKNKEEKCTHAQVKDADKDEEAVDKDEEKAEPKKLEKSEEKSDKAEPKKVEEEKDSED